MFLRLIFIGLVPCSGPGPFADAGTDGSVRFHVVTVEQIDGVRNVLSEATVDGPDGTDFEIELRGTRFEMSARFLTDGRRSGTIPVKAMLETRRLWGRSERGLPLYEEDRQSHDLQLDLREQIVLLPFGRPVDGESLRIEITPSELASHARSGPELEIDIVRPSPEGVVNIRAFRVPHRFRIEAALLADGVQVAGGGGICVIEDSRSFVLSPTAVSSGQPSLLPIEITVDVERVLRERGGDLVALEFQLGRERGAGVAPLGVPLEYGVSIPGESTSRRKHALRITVFDQETGP